MTGAARKTYFFLFVGIIGFFLFWKTFAAMASSDMVGYWKFDEGVGTTAANTVAGGNDGTLVNNPSWVAGRHGNAVDFDGVNDLVNIGAYPEINNLNDFSIAMWFWADSTGQTKKGTFFLKDSAFEAKFSSYNSKIYFDAERWSGSSGTWRLSMPGSASLPADCWTGPIDVSESDPDSAYLEVRGIGRKPKKLLYKK